MLKTEVGTGPQASEILDYAHVARLWNHPALVELDLSHHAINAGGPRQSDYAASASRRQHAAAARYACSSRGPPHLGSLPQR